MKEDKGTIWGFDLDNLSKFKDYVNKMKDECEDQKKKNMFELENIEMKIDSDPEKDVERNNRTRILLAENENMTQFVESSLKNIEIKLDLLLESSKKTDIKKSLYHPDNYNLNLTHEKDDSLAFQVGDISFK